jgi:hypothetical protein
LGIIKEHRLNNKFNNNILSVIFDADSFFYSVSDKDHNLYLAAKHSLEIDPFEEIQQIIKKEQLHLFDYAAVKLYSKFHDFTLLPSEEVKGKDLKIFAKNAYSNQSIPVLLDHNRSEDIDVIHSIPEPLVRVFNLLTDNVKIRHLSNAWIDMCKNDGMYVFLYENDFSILVTKNGDFVYYNIFDYAGKEDAFYFIMLGFQEFELDPDADYIFIDGISGNKNELIEMIQNYVKNISRIRRGFNNLGDSSDILDLYAASICE